MSKRAQLSADGDTAYGEIVKDKGPAKNSFASRDIDVNDCLPDSGEYILDFDGIPIHVKLVAKRRKCLRIKSSGKVKAIITGGSSRKEALDFFANNKDRILGSIIEMRKYSYISEIVILYDNSIKVSANTNDCFRAYGVLVHLQYDDIYAEDGFFKARNDGVILFQVGKNIKIPDIVKTLKLEIRYVQKQIDMLYTNPNEEGTGSESIKPCLIAYKDFLVEIIPVKQGEGISYNSRPDGIIQASVPIRYASERISEFLENCEDNMLNLLLDRFFLKPNEQKLLASIRTPEALTSVPETIKDHVIDKSVLERAMKYIGKGEYAMDIDGLDVKIIVENVSKCYLKEESRNNFEISVPPYTPKSFILDYMRKILHL
ncbi:MAG: hypothetical protein LBR22_02560 [Desulfovibrio sp.]|nr:hypothetical protein [Desulfovibrio sp.]